jgi:hypothetical protein
MGSRTGTGRFMDVPTWKVTSDKEKHPLYPSFHNETRQMKSEGTDCEEQARSLRYKVWHTINSRRY